VRVIVVEQPPVVPQERAAEGGRGLVVVGEADQLAPDPEGVGVVLACHAFLARGSSDSITAHARSGGSPRPTTAHEDQISGSTAYRTILSRG
jgi:hypothetical protein